MTGLALAAIAVPLLGIALAVVAARGRWQIVTVRGVSMTPTLRDGDRVVVDTGNRLPASGDLVVFRIHQGFDGLNWMVKRAVAVPGDAVPSDMRAVVTDQWVRRGCLLVRGDNPASRDSRHFGYVPVDAVLGTVTRFGGRRKVLDARR